MFKPRTLNPNPVHKYICRLVYNFITSAQSLPINLIATAYIFYFHEILYFSYINKYVVYKQFPIMHITNVQQILSGFNT